MLRFLSTILAVVVGLFVFCFLFVFVIITAVAGSSRSKPLPSAMVLELDARQGIGDAPSSINMPSGFGGSSLTVVGIVEGLEQAKKDPSVKGLLIRTGSSLGVQPGQVEEIRDAVEDFRASGKFVISHVQDMSNPGLGGYYLASAAEQIWLQPSGTIFTQGFATSGLYFKGTLEKLDSYAEVLHYYEYKSAMFPFMHDGPTEAENEQELRLLTSIFDSFTGEIAKSREMTKEQFTALLNKGPFIGEEAVKSGWVDKLGFETAAKDAAKERAGENSKIVELANYRRQKGSPYKEGPVIAFVQGSGQIVEGKAEQSLFGASDQLASDTTSEAILAAAEDKDVKAIIFRVDSPGGSATASDQVWNAVALARAKGKPVVINMSGVAASGGYWISMGADKIIAEPSTITGSIGVVGAKIVLKGLYTKLGVTSSETSVGGDKAFMFSDQHPFTPQEWLALREMFDDIYGNFVRKVADGRKLPVETVEAIAKGRVWSGSDAKARGLVDELGGLKELIAAAKKLAKIDEKSSVQLRSFPSEKPFLAGLFEAFGASAEIAHSLGVFAEIMRLQPTAEVIDALREQEATRASPLQVRTREPQIQ